MPERANSGLKKNYSIVMMAGKQAGCIGLLTLLALGHRVIQVVCYDDIILSIPVSINIKVKTLWSGCWQTGRQRLQSESTT